MKIKLSLIILFTALGSLGSNVCSDSENLFLVGSSKLNNYTYARDFQVFKKKSKIGEGHEVYPMTFNRGMTYKIYLLESESYDGKLMLNVFNNMKQDFLVASNYNQSLNKRYSSVEFSCRSTINGCIDLFFQDGIKGCGIAIVGFRKE